MSLEQDLLQRKRDSKIRARFNYALAYMVLFIAVAASGAATIAVATESPSKKVTAVLAGLPGALLLVMKTFKFDARAEWWWDRHHRMDALLRGLQYEKRSEEDVSRDLTAFLVSQAKKWPSFGEPPGAA